MRFIVQIVAILNLLAITVCIVAGMWMGYNPEAVPTWEYLTAIPMVMTFISPFLALFPSVMNHRPTLALLVCSMPPLSWLMIPMLFIKRSPPPT